MFKKKIKEKLPPEDFPRFPGDEPMDDDDEVEGEDEEDIIPPVKLRPAPVGKGRPSRAQEPAPEDPPKSFELAEDATKYITEDEDPELYFEEFMLYVRIFVQRRLSEVQVEKAQKPGVGVRVRRLGR